ncbi:short-chain dehydrogenase/reductase SDR [Streptomyces albus]|uniref:Short-chain dehydrogenase/reductase SDR n=1 Tax=Streptomyces albus (strain ATCC 21838 / DSM 41398 / FERM P-419 / JCM 4703 / NBRC 107858) TaxID=1081613 RepID=A0A0B5EQN6_STRA4|nr:short-chain dehydrogenase/reductase SDR [Streptomyces albus]AOU74787.1 short-chain dehydrogenase/reductase SDR [Streptomyces albus]AYN30598.1 short-chain dehydrogenase/reductase SDR [Streptomyces albus]
MISAASTRIHSSRGSSAAAPRPGSVIEYVTAGDLGATLARRLGRDGHHVIVNYRTGAADAADVVRDVEAAGGSATSTGADVTDPGAEIRAGHLRPPRRRGERP